MLKEVKTPPITEIIPDKNPGKVRLFIKREDQLHPIISGNKWRKLKYNLLAAREAGKSTLLTFGGAYSNHIHAVAGAAKEYGFKCIGIIRGEEHLPLNPTLREATEMGMEIHYMNRSTYRQKHTKEVIDLLRKTYGDVFVIPEGGTNELALQGAAEIVQGIENDYDCFCVACGTAGTAAGIISGLNGQSNVLGFSVLKGDFHQQEINDWLTALKKHHLSNWHVSTDYHFGGYAKFDLRLVNFINSFKNDHKIQLDPIYTGKLLFGVFDLIAKSYFPANSKVLTIHSGGLQGIEGFNQRFSNLIKT